MKIEFKIPDIQLEVTINGASTQFFDMLKLMEGILHFFRTKEWIRDGS